MIDVGKVLNSIPDYRKFCSVADLADLAESLRSESTFDVQVAGTSPRGLPIHHVRFGHGPLRALLVGFPHPNEPIGGLTAHALLTLLKQGHSELTSTDIEWHIVPCIDPDGALLNEGWSQQPFTIDNFMRNSHRPELQHQVDCTFPITYKRLDFDNPSAEATTLRGLLTRICPDFYYSLHNTATGGGVWYALTRALDPTCYKELHGLVADYNLRLRKTTDLGDWSIKFAEGIFENYETKKLYDFLEKTSPNPEMLMQHGECSWEYLQRIHPGAFTLVTELPYLKHPSDGSTKPTNLSFRRLRLRLDSEYKYVAASILEEWDRVAPDLDSTSAFFKKTFFGLVRSRESINEGVPSWPYKSRDILFNASYSRTISEGERFTAYLEKLSRLCQSYEFVRLLKASKQTAAVIEATRRMETIFEIELDDIKSNIDVEAFTPIELTTLAKVQLGSGLILVNAMLCARGG